jgi:hypothetical protein
MLGSIIGGLIGADNQQAAADHQKNAVMQILAKLDAVGMPPDRSAAIILEQYQQQGLLTPQLEAQIQASASEFQNIKSDSSLRDTQKQALQQMSRYGKAGLTPEERAEMQKSRQSVQRDLEAKQQQITQNLAARGQGGGGSEIAQRLLASQSGADRASEEGDRVSSLASQRALQAISQSAGMAGSLRQQDYGEQTDRAAAMDQMNRFNTENQMNINQRNVSAGNVAQTANLANKQSISNQNVAGANNEKYDQVQRQRQNWLDKLNYAQAYASPLTNYGDINARTENQKANRAASIGKGIDDGIMNAVAMSFGMPPTNKSSPSNDGQGPTNENAKQQSGTSFDWSKLMGGGK